MSTPEKDEVSGTETTGHEWDGVKELNTPLPKWWLSIFYATIIWGVAIMVAYPAWPLISSATEGFLGYSTRSEALKELEDSKKAQSKWRERIAKASLSEILADAELRRFAVAAGRAAYGLHCSQCHGSGAAGARGYPNLNDDAWIWGGKIEEIYATIKHGVRNSDSDEARVGEMPAFGEILSADDIKAVTASVLKLASLDHDAALTTKGDEVYAENCASCHGDKGEGNTELGAPKLADAIWLYGGDAESIGAQIRKPSHGVMPAWGLRLDDVTVKELSVYVFNLGGGVAGDSGS